MKLAEKEKLMSGLLLTFTERAALGPSEKN